LSCIIYVNMSYICSKCGNIQHYNNKIIKPEIPKEIKEVEWINDRNPSPRNYGDFLFLENMLGI